MGGVPAEQVSLTSNKTQADEEKILMKNTTEQRFSVLCVIEVLNVCVCGQNQCRLACIFF